MSRNLRFIPEPGQLVHVVNRCAEARHFLRPSRNLNDCVVGVLGRAQRRTGVEVVATAVLSSHLHLLLVVENALQLAQFMHFVDCNIAKEVNRLLGRSGPFWQGRYRATLVANTEEDQVAVFRYLLEQGCKENLVMSPLDWPGVHSALASSLGESLSGTWTNRTALCAGRQRGGKAFEVKDARTQETLKLSPLPCWKPLTKEEYQRKTEDLVKSIVHETKERHRRAGTRPLGARKVLRGRPGFRPKDRKNTHARMFRSARKELREQLLEAYRTFLRAFRDAAEALKQSGDLSKFPPGSFPPGAPFVPLLEPG